jgi:hypothetical protein
MSFQQLLPVLNCAILIDNYAAHIVKNWEYCKGKASGRL